MVYLGLLLKLEKLFLGFEAIEDGIKRKIVSLIIIANDTSEKTKKEVKFICDKYGIKFVIFGTIQGNSHSIGKSNRAIIGICDSGFAKRFMELAKEI